MSSFDTVHKTKNNFVKHNKAFLKGMIGYTDITPLWIADMDFKVAEPITEEIQRIAERGIYSYEFITHKVFKAIASWNKKRHGLKMNPKYFNQVTTGVLTTLAVIIKELTEEGEEVIIQTPVYHQFQKVIESNGRKVLANPLKLSDGRYTMDLVHLEKLMKKNKPKAMILCNPHNPVGRVWTKEEIGAILELADNYGVTILSDEIHSDIVYEGAAFNSISSFEKGLQHITILGSPAKTFGMHGIANAYFYTENEDLFNLLKKSISAMYLDHGNAISVYATIAAYKKGGEWVDELVTYLSETIDWVQEFLQDELSQVKLIQSEGTYQLWLDFRDLKLSSEELEKLIFERAKLGLAPGKWFDEDHEQFMRINIASPKSVIQEAFYALKREVDSL